ncbi:hypothetical protein FQA39_LY08592 [Lamprigera yunnana]|nr:hypothetical protein FQA39_LY08592 [Lamprigera yunnana]
MPKIFTPTNQLRLTNVAVVRLKKCGKRFEIACYKNKIISWRNKVEKNIDEVLQTHTIFINVSKGEVAKKEDIIRVFGDKDDTEICKEILSQGDIQISDRERQHMLEAQFKEIAVEVTNRCVNPSINLPYPLVVIEKAMRNAHYSVKPHQNVKQQALNVIKLLKKSIPIERAQMKLKISCVNKNLEEFKEQLSNIPTVKIEFDKVTEDSITIGFLIDPGNYKEVEDITKKEEGCFLEIVSYKEISSGDHSF